MTKLYPMQVIALDKISHQALDLAELKRFDEIVKIETKQLASVTIGDYHQIFVLSELNEMIMEEIAEELSEVEEPIVLLPNTVKESESMKQLLLLGARVVFSSSDSLVAVSLSHALRMLELMFYENGTEMEIAVGHEDIYSVMGRGTLTEFYENSGTHVSATTMNALNVPEGFSDVSGAYILYDIHEDLPIMQIAEAMDVVENMLPEESSIVFGTRNTHTNMKYVKIICMISRYIDFKVSLQKEITESKSYLGKVSVIVDAFNENEITADEAKLLAQRNSLEMDDLDTIYKISYTMPLETVRLMQMMQDIKISTARKIEAIADVVIEESVNTYIAEEITNMQSLSIDDVLSIIQLKKEGKLPLQDVEMSNGFKDKYPNLTIAKSADTLVLLNKDDLQKEGGGIMTIETEELTLYEKDGMEWFVGKNLEENKVDNFIREYVQSIS